MAYTHNPTWDTPVWGPGTCTSYVDVDLSALIGDAGRYLVFCMARLAASTIFGGPSTAGGVASIRPKGLSVSLHNGSGRSAGIAAAYVPITPTNGEMPIATITDEASVIQLSCNPRSGEGGSRTIELYVLGWCPWTYASAVINPDGALPTSWTDADLSGHLGGSGKALVLWQLNRTNNSQAMYGIRKNADSEVGLISNRDGFGPNFHADYSPGYSCQMLCPTDSSQIVEQAAGAALSGSTEILGKATDWTPVEEVVYGPAAFPASANTWTDLDLSDFVGKRRVAVVLRVKRTGLSTNDYADFRPKDMPVAFGAKVASQSRGCAGIHTYNASAGGYIIVPTDQNGVVEWNAAEVTYNYTITLEGYLDVPEPSGVYRSLAQTSLSEATLSLALAAGTYDALIASGDVVIEAASFYVDTAGATFTSVSVQTDQTSAVTLLTASEGAVANLTAQKTVGFAYSRFPFILKDGQKLQYTISGSTGTGSLTLVVVYRPLIPDSGATLGVPLV